MLTEAAALRELIGQPPPPAEAAELAELAARAERADQAADGTGERDHPVAAIADPAALRSWALDLCWSSGGGAGTVATSRPS